MLLIELIVDSDKNEIYVVRSANGKCLFASKDCSKVVSFIHDNVNVCK